MSTLTFAASMEKSIGINIEKLKDGCSPELCDVLELLAGFQQEYELVLTHAKSLPQEQSPPELEPSRLLGTDENWRKLTGAFLPDTAPNAQDYTVLWSVHSMLDKNAQFYQQASKQSVQPQLRLFFGSVAELKLMLRRRIDGVERVLANQVWKEVGFAPGLLGKE